jgi:predicted ester cyclase
MSLSELNDFGKKYAKAWCSQNPHSVARFFSEAGSLSVNDAIPAVGREAIAEVAQGFMAAFPDMEVRMDDLVSGSEGTVFHWTLTGRNTGPHGTGNRVRISGYEVWRIGADALIAESKGHFDSADYQYQLEHGVEG